MTRSYALDDPAEVARELGRLRIQADALFPLESRALDELGVPEPRVVIDVGCGIGAYMACLRRRWPAARIVGVDRHAGLLAHARAAGEEVLEADAVASMAGILAEVRPDLVVLRLVLQHLRPDERARLLDALRGVDVLAIETDTRTFHAGSAAVRELARRLNQSVSAHGGDRTLGVGAVPGARAVAVTVSPATVGWRAWWKIHWPIWRALCDDPTVVREARAWLKEHDDVSSQLFVSFRRAGRP